MRKCFSYYDSDTNIPYTRHGIAVNVGDYRMAGYGRAVCILETKFNYILI